MRLRNLLLVASFLAAGPAAGYALGSKEVADRVSGELREQIPDYVVTESDEQTLKILKADKQLFQVNLAEIQKFCAADSDNCEDAITSFVGKVAGLVKSQAGTPTLTQAMLRGIVREASYADALNHGLPGAASDPLVTKALAPNMIALCVFDQGDALRPARLSDLKPLGLTQDGALAACEANTAAHLPSLEDVVQQLGAHSFSMLQGDYYTASQFMFPENWKDVNKEMASKLIVCIVGTNLIVYGREDTPSDVAAMHRFVDQMKGAAGHPISTDIYRWTKTGWQIAQE
jgi:hypothetical protein